MALGNKANNNNNKPAGRGRPPGRPKGKGKPSQETISSNYTLAGLQEKKKRSMSQGSAQDSSLTASPAKKRSINGPSSRDRFSSRRDSQTSSPSAIPVPTSTSNVQARRTRASSQLLNGNREIAQQYSTLSDGSHQEKEGHVQLEDQGASQEPHLQPPPTLHPQTTNESIPDSALKQLLDRFNAVERKLGILDSMEKQLGKLDVIETKTTNIDAKIHNIQKSVETIYEKLTPSSPRFGKIRIL